MSFATVRPGLAGRKQSIPKMQVQNWLSSSRKNVKHLPMTLALRSSYREPLSDCSLHIGRHVLLSLQFKTSTEHIDGGLNVLRV